MTDNIPLSDLCRICNDATPKYCCPRCSTRTCSLTCYKRHQTWSQCSGKRDPGAYVKRSQLATAAGIDHDYNFLTGIERAFDNADRDVEERGMVSTGKRGREVNPGSNIGKRLAASGAIIKRAPVGMSRQKSNKTQWIPKHQCIAWTVEWVSAHGRKQLGSCRENLAISEGYGHIFPNPAKRRKVSVGAEEIAPADSKRVRGEKAVNDKKVAVNSSSGDSMVADSLPGAGHADFPRVPAVGEAEAILTMDDTANIHATSTDKNTEPPDDSRPPAQDIPTTTPPPPDPSPQLKHYYLHSPLTSSLLPVLIPLTPTSTLSTCLTNRLILEYPTIYVLDEPPSSLPDTYLLEAEYKKREKKMIEELDEEEKALGFVEGSVEMMRKRREEEREVDTGMEERRVLESLRRDVSALGGGL